MSRPTILDRDGDERTVFEVRDTPHGFPVLLGRRVGSAPNAGAGRTQAILTGDLAACLTAHRRDRGAFDLPRSPKAGCRLRRELGHHRDDDAAAWWTERTGDLQARSGAAFARKHGSRANVSADERRERFGPALRPAGGWKAPEVVVFFFSGRPDAEVAAELGFAYRRVGSLRTRLRKGGLAP